MAYRLPRDELERLRLATRRARRPERTRDRESGVAGRQGRNQIRRAMRDRGAGARTELTVAECGPGATHAEPWLNRS